MMIRWKVCCISSIGEARLAISAGANALGLVSAMPSGPGVVDEATIAEVAATVPPGVDTFLLTSLTAADELMAQQRRCGAPTLQLCDRVAPAVRARLKRELPGIRLVQVVHVTGEASRAEAIEAALHADALLLDSGTPDAASKTLGGTGRVHDWGVSAAIVDEATIPVWLAGGLRADNLREAITRVRPFGLDICGGLRTEGRLDATKLAAFARELASCNAAPL
jgi:phosphoribosylanthranilate isomerase